MPDNKIFQLSLQSPSIELLGDLSCAMQFALPPRGGTLPLHSSGRSRLSYQRRRQLKVAAVIGLAVISLFFIFSYLRSSSITSSVPAGTSGIVIVTVLDRAALSEKYIHRIKKNREDYVKQHGRLLKLFYYKASN